MLIRDDEAINEDRIEIRIKLERIE